MATAAYPIESVFSAYRRSDDGALRERRDDLFAARKDELAEARPLVAVAARRVAAVAGGATAAAGAAILVGLAIGRALIERPREGGGSLTLALLGGVAASLAVWGATRVGAQALLGARLARDITVSDDPRRDLPRLEQAEVVARAVRWARRFPVAANALPLCGFALLAPLSLHWVVSGLSGGGSFDEWIAISLVVAGHSHIAVAVASWLYARRLATAPRPRHWLAASMIALAVAAGVAIVPTVVFAPILVFATGLIPLPLAFALASWRASRERALLAAMDDEAVVGPF